MQVQIDSGRCIACGMCAYTAPEVFRITGASSTVHTQPQGRNSFPLSPRKGSESIQEAASFGAASWIAAGCFFPPDMV